MTNHIVNLLFLSQLNDSNIKNMTPIVAVKMAQYLQDNQ